MTDNIATTPFGGGRMSERVFARQSAVSRRQEALRAGEGGNDTGKADKWQLLRALTEARFAYGLGDRTICLLEALVSFTNERELDGSQPIIVFPSNRELSMRARGMAPATLRRHLAALVDAGMIFRRDSANGKRYARRDDTGQVEDAFGFDLAPLALQAADIHAAAEEERLRLRQERALRSEVTLHQRDISKIIACALEEGRGGDWLDYTDRLAAIAGPLPRHAALDILAARRDDLVRLRAEVENTYLSMLSEEEMSANDDQSERHIQNSNTDSPFELKGYDLGRAGTAAEPKPAPEQKLAVSLARVKRICPQIGDYARNGITTWADLIATADLVRSMLGVSPDAWRKARAAMGEQAAAVVVAMMLERAESIRSPGGYLRDLTQKAEKSSFSIFPMLQALERTRE
jgi:replication initiation protein RepC